MRQFFKKYHRISTAVKSFLKHHRLYFSALPFRRNLQTGWRKWLFLAGGAVILALLLSGVIFYARCRSGGCEKELVAEFTVAESSWQELAGPFLTTSWAQDGVYAALAPGREPLGCWSVAFAQILAYYQRQPYGRVSYITSGGMVIDDLLTDRADWDALVPSIGPDTPSLNALATARYIFYVAEVVQKDFGTGEYMDVERISDNISAHYGVTVRRVESGFVDTVKSELSAGRPLVAYFDDILDIGVVRNGHAAVLDGVAFDAGKMFVHINFGWGGKSDGWYDFKKLSRQRELLYVFSVTL